MPKFISNSELTVLKVCKGTKSAPVSLDFCGISAAVKEIWCDHGYRAGLLILCSRADRRPLKLNFSLCPTPLTSWHTAAMNENEKRAAQRFGFTPEGVFQQHRVFKGQNRDSAYFSVLDSEWP
ncbi:hypothetical protein Ddc_12399 [Ditylenchus destructor]|nr:hypothetical protein Ddc_12399 [Ditylenchus destructor]